MRSSFPKPFVKWAGGKGQLLDTIDSNLPVEFKRYFEPFVGGGAVFFHLYRQGFRGKTTLSDLNGELMIAYRTICDSIDELIMELQSGKYEPNEDVFYSIRAWDRTPDWKEVDNIRQTARLIYLNRTCYNGLYRVNQKGYFNVPYGGYKNPTICNVENLQAVSKSLKKAKLLSVDFASVVEDARKGDLVYFDPPYQPVSETAAFTEYTSGGFGEEEQRRLSAVFRQLHRRGCFVLESNSATPLIREIYSDEEFVLETVHAKRAISCDPEGRGEVPELLIRNYLETVQTRLG
ncbi:MAG: DNA adenine methylase [Candidatus Thorarchaeota archaeon]